MHIPQARLLSLALCIAAASGTANLLTYVDGSVGNILGNAFGAPGTNATFDYVIVGGGTAGLTIATRLASDPAISVAVIEAGGFYEVDNGNRSTVPGYANFYTGSDPNNYQPLVDWGFTTVAQPVRVSSVSAMEFLMSYSKSASGVADRRFSVGSGKSQNTLCPWQDIGRLQLKKLHDFPGLWSNSRPTRGSLQKWADEVDDQSYTWDNFLPFYRKSCNYTPYNPALYNSTILPQEAGVFDPAGGPLHVSFSNYADAFGTWAQKAFTGVGMRVINGLNAGVLNGSAYSTLTVDPRNGYRSSSESSFLQAALQNGTAPTIYKNSLARRILFNSTTATGVLVTTAGPYGIPPLNYTLTARKEVIVSAGVFQSPQLLMVSGIGPQATLQQYGIQVLKDLAGVGQNMWDHVLFGANRRVNVLTASASLNNPVLAAKSAAQFRANGSGPLSAFGAGYYGWEALPQPYRSNLSSTAIAALATFPSDWPELEWLPISAYLGYQTNRQTEDPRDGHNYATINPGLLSPLSRGNVTISSADMSDPPILNPNWLTDPTDQEVAVQSFKRSREIWSVLAENNVTADDMEYLPGLNVTSDADILAYIQASFMTIYHAAATCKMGSSNDSMAVVDSQARVYGTQNLRVVDASSFPFLPPGHPQSTVYALAEKIAADILGANVPPPGYSMSGYAQDVAQEQTRLQTLTNSSNHISAQQKSIATPVLPSRIRAVTLLAVSSIWLIYFL